MLHFNTPLWALKQLQHKFSRKQKQDSNHNPNSTTINNLNSNNHKNITIVVSYIQGIGERFKKVTLPSSCINYVSIIVFSLRIF